MSMAPAREGPGGGAPPKRSDGPRVGARLRSFALLFPGAVGAAVLLVHLTARPSAGAASVLEAVLATLRAPGFAWALVAALTALLLLHAFTVGGRPAWFPLDHRRLVSFAAGLTVPLAIPLLEPWSFRCLAPPMVLLGIAVAVTWPRGQGGEGSPTITGSWRGHLAVAVLAAVAAASLLPLWPEPGGDEPHYLLAARSILVDGDLDLAADYAEGRYAPFWEQGLLAPHTKPGLVPGSRFSTHGFGYPLLLALPLALGGDADGAVVARSMQILLYALFAALLFELVRAVGGAAAGRSGTLAAVLLGPLVFAPLALFPELPVMLLALLAYLLAREPARQGRVLAAGMAIAILPWIAMKTILLALALAAVGVARAPAPLRRVVIPRLLAPVAVSAAVHAALTWRLYGTVSPLAIYVGADPESGRHTAFGTDWAAYLADLPGALAAGIGHLIDQKEGLLAIGPHYLLAALGIGWMWRRHRFEAVALVAIYVAHAGPYALAQEIGGQSLPARPLLPIVWALAVPMALGMTVTGVGRGVRWLRGSLLALAAAHGLFLAADPGLMSHDYSVPMSRTLLALSPQGADLWRWFPLWLNSDRAWSMVSLLWAAAALAGAAWLSMRGAAAAAAQERPRPSPPSVTATRAFAATLAALALFGVFARAVPLQDSHVQAPLWSGLSGSVPQFYPETAWVEEGRVWVRPGGWREVVLSSQAPLASLRLVLAGLTGGAAQVRHGSLEFAVGIDPEEPRRVDLALSGGRRQNGSWHYLLHVRTTAGARPADLGGGEDYRLLGAELRVVRARPREVTSSGAP